MLLRLEVFCFFLSFFYIGYYIIDRVLHYYFQKRSEKTQKIQKKELREKKRKKHKEKQENASDDPETIGHKKYVSAEQSEQIREIVKRAQINVSRGYLESARGLIIEGLALKKEDKDLNLLLADVYEREKKYQNASYIYRDMLEIHIDDDYVLQRLGNIYVLLGKNKRSFEVYQKAFKQNRTNIEVLDILSHLGLEIKEYKKSFKYANLYLKEKPRNGEKLGIKGYCLEKLGKREDAIKAYNKVLDIQPYNTEIQDRIAALQK